jgi:hypothetical protein
MFRAGCTFTHHHPLRICHFPPPLPPPPSLFSRVLASLGLAPSYPPVPFLSPSITHLAFHSKFDMVFKHYPHSITHIKFGNSYNQVITFSLSLSLSSSLSLSLTMMQQILQNYHQILLTLSWEMILINPPLPLSLFLFLSLFLSLLLLPPPLSSCSLFLSLY